MMEMGITFEVKASKVGNSTRITIPVPVMKSLGIQTNDILLLTVVGEKIVITKKKEGQP